MRNQIQSCSALLWEWKFAPVGKGKGEFAVGSLPFYRRANLGQRVNVSSKKHLQRNSWIYPRKARVAKMSREVIVPLHLAFVRLHL